MYVKHNGRLRQVAWVGTDTDQNAADYVRFAEDTDMVHAWSQSGFVYNEGTEDEPRFVEVARRLAREDG